MNNKTIFSIIVGLLIVIAGVGAYAVTRNPSMPAQLAGEAGSIPGKVVSAVGEQTSAPDSVATPAADRTITMAEVAQHATSQDCYTAVNGVVYDLTPFIARHPGGVAAISSLCGIDGTAGFKQMHGGSKKPEAQLAKLRIGVVAQ